MYGVYGKLLRIDLTKKSVKEETIPDDAFQKYLGGKGLGAYLLLKYLTPKVDPLSPDNKLIFTTGPATGTSFPSAGRYGVFAKSPQTGFFGEGYSGGHVAPVIKQTGYDAIMIEGAAKDPLYLHVSDHGVEFGDASDLWGQETYKTENELLKRVNVKGAQALVIGEAGENLVSYACIKNNSWRSVGRTGLGAVMGSKKLKGIVFSGSQKAPLYDEQMLKDYVKDLIKKYANTDRTKLLKGKGTAWMVATANEACAFPTRYWEDGTYDKYKGITADAMNERLDVKPRGCYRCFIACARYCTILNGRHKGLIIEGPEYETIYALGGLLDIDQIEEVCYLNDICDRLGIDTISAGNMVSFAIEAGRRGKLSGMPDFGDVDGIAELLYRIVRKEGNGELLSKGIIEAANTLGLEDLAIHVKGLEPAGYDPRRVNGMSLGYATSERGACHLRSSFYMAELRGEVPKELKEKTKYFIKYESRNTLDDCLITCRFYYQFIGFEGMKTILKATMGVDYSEDDLTAVAKRVKTLTKWFNIREGWTKKDDSVPPRLFKEPIGPNKEYIVPEQDFEIMLKEYYNLHGWNEDGIPKEQLLL